MLQGSGSGYQKACPFDKEGAPLGQAENSQKKLWETIVIMQKLHATQTTYKNTKAVHKVWTVLERVLEKGQRTVRSLDREVYTLMDSIM